MAAELLPSPMFASARRRISSSFRMMGAGSDGLLYRWKVHATANPNRVNAGIGRIFVTKRLSLVTPSTCSCASAA